MKRAPLQALLAAMPAWALAGSGWMMNPAMMTGTMGGSSPLGQMNPMVMMHPLGMANPLGMGGAPMLGLGMLHPAMQMAPNMMSYQHLNQMTNPYLGGPFAGNPYLRPTLPFPMTPPAFAPSLPFSRPAASPAPMFGMAMMPVVTPKVITPMDTAPLPFTLPGAHDARPRPPVLDTLPPTFDPSGWFKQRLAPSGQ